MNLEKWKYCAKVRRQLLCSRRTKKRILASLEGRIDAWLEENPGARREQIEARFGTPAQIAASYIADRSSEELLREMMIRGRIARMVVAALAVILISWAGVIAYAAIDAKLTKPIYINGNAMTSPVDVE